jgi:hypothetical protein
MVHTLGRAPWTAELYARAVASAVLPGFVWGGGDELPGSQLRLTHVRFTPADITAYRGVCGGSGPGVPTAMPHLPGFPLALKLMTARDFPMSALGMVHVANEISVLDELDPAAEYDVGVELANPRQHPKGTQFDAVTSASCDGQVVWRETSTYLSRGTRLVDAAEASPRPRWPDRSRQAEVVTIEVPADTGRRYASVSGDRNPIHLHPLTARAFGFPTAIAHGMWTLARSLAQVESELPKRYVVKAGFFKPLFLPSSCQLYIDRDPGRWNLWMMSGDTMHAALVVTDDHARTT